MNTDRLMDNFFLIQGWTTCTDTDLWMGYLLSTPCKNRMGNRSSKANVDCLHSEGDHDYIEKPLLSKKPSRLSTVVEIEEEPSEDCDWVKDYDDQRQRAYYYNPKTQETSWEIPTKQQQKPVDEEKDVLDDDETKLPPGTEWKTALDRSSGKTYYYYPPTQKASWVSPVKRLILDYKSNRGFLDCTLQDSLSSIRTRLAEEWDSDMLPEDSSWLFGLSGNIRITQRQENKGTLQDFCANKVDDDFVLYILDRPKRVLDRAAKTEPPSKRAVPNRPAKMVTQPKPIAPPIPRQRRVVKDI